MFKLIDTLASSEQAQLSAVQRYLYVAVIRHPFIFSLLMTSMISLVYDTEVNRPLD